MTLLEIGADVDRYGPPPLPEPRGPRSDHLIAHLRHPAHDPGPLPDRADDPIDGEDGPLTLHLMYELHYRGFDGVDERWEWEPGLLRERRRLEDELEQRVAELVGPPPVGLTPAEVAEALDDLVAAGGLSLSAWVEEHGRLEHLRELAVHRSIYQLREADPHTFGIPRIAGPPKAALLEIQRGEYGDGSPEAVHAELFADTLAQLDLEPGYGAHLEAVPGLTLSTVNLLDLFALHRRWRGALVGHLALFEMASVGPMGRYAAVLRRLGRPAAAPFYDEHVVADAQHEVIARDRLATGLARTEPVLSGEIAFGARALGAIEARFASALVSAWSMGRSSLLRPLPG